MWVSFPGTSSVAGERNTQCFAPGCIRESIMDRKLANRRVDVHKRTISLSVYVRWLEAAREYALEVIGGIRDEAWVRVNLPRDEIV